MMPNNPKNFLSGNNPRPIERSLRLFALLTLFLLLLMSLWFKLSSEVAIQFANFISSTLLSALLLLAYLRSTEIQDSQEGIQERQKDIQSQQRDLLRLEHEPKLKVKKIKPKNNPNSFKLMITNIGKAPANNIRLSIIPHSECEDLTLAPSHNKIGRENSDSGWLGADDDYLEPNEKDIFIAGSGPRAKREDSPLQKELVPWTFELISEKLSKDGKKKYRFSLVLEYSGPDGTDYSEDIVKFIVPIKGRTALTEAIKLGTTKEKFESIPEGYTIDMDLKQEKMDRNTAEKQEQSN